MGTTVWVDDGTRAELRRLQASLRLPSVDATIRRLLEHPTRDARSLFGRHHDAIREVLSRHRLDKLVAFGSRARGDARPDSDLDLAVRVAAGAGPLAVLSAEADLEALLGVRVNLVELPNPAVAAAIRKDGVRFVL